MIHNLKQRLQTVSDALDRSGYHVEAVTQSKISDRIMNWQSAAWCELQSILEELKEEENEKQ